MKDLYKPKRNEDGVLVDNDLDIIVVEDRKIIITLNDDAGDHKEYLHTIAADIAEMLATEWGLCHSVRSNFEK